MSRRSAESAAPAVRAEAGRQASRVRHRQIFYISGFDPKGPAHYHRLYLEQAALAGAVGGYRVEVGKRRSISDISAVWPVRFFTDAQSTQAEVTSEFEYLRWDDIVRAHWTRNPLRLARDLFGTTLLYLRSGALWRMARLSWPPALALFMPFVLLIGLLLSLPAALLIGRSSALATESAWAGAAAAAVWLAAVGALALLVERRMNVQWLLRSYAFTGRQGTRGWPALEDRLDSFARRIVERVQQRAADCDELLIIAHSSGSIMAQAALARALAVDPALTARGPRIALLTLGQWSPLLSSLPSAARFRDELARIANEAAIDWVDFSAPPDGCCFALTDPIAAAGLPVARPDHPRLLSPRFAATNSATAYAAIRRDRLRMHFQYLMAAESPGEYDYTAITAGPTLLADRFAQHPSVGAFRQFRLFG